MADGISFSYEAQTMDGHPFRGTVEAASTEDAQARLAALQLRVLTVAPSETKGKKRDTGLGADDFIVFNQQLAQLADAGIPIDRGLRLIALDMRSGRLAKAAQDVAADLEKGMSLKDAFSQQASRFPPLYGRMVEAGASAGALPGILFNLGKHMELTTRLRQSLWRTLAYPVVVLVAMSLVLLLIATVVLPQFEDIFKDFRTTLPTATTMLLSFGHIYPMILGTVAVTIALIVIVDLIAKGSGGLGIYWEGLLWYMPGIGGVLRASLLARWIDALRLGVQAGLDLPQSLSLASEATAGANGALSRDAERLASLVATGAPISDFSGRVIPATVPAAIDLASSSGDLPGALQSLTQIYEQQAEHRLRILPSILTPLLVVFMATSVGFCVVAMFLPLVKLVQAVSGGG